MNPGQAMGGVSLDVVVAILEQGAEKRCSRLVGQLYEGGYGLETRGLREDSANARDQCVHDAEFFDHAVDESAVLPLHQPSVVDQNVVKDGVCAPPFRGIAGDVSPLDHLGGRGDVVGGAHPPAVQDGAMRNLHGHQEEGRYRC